MKNAVRIINLFFALALCAACSDGLSATEEPSHVPRPAPTTLPESSPEPSPSSLEGGVASGPCDAGAERSCYAGPESVVELEACHFGTQQCESEVWGPCVGWARPVNRACGTEGGTSSSASSVDPSGHTSSTSSSPSPGSPTPSSSSTSTSEGESTPADSGPSGPAQSDPSSKDPNPTDPDPTDPDPTDPDPTDPDPTDPDPTDPDPTDPDPTDPGPPEPGIYRYDRLPIATFGRPAAVDWHPSGEWALIVEGNGVLQVVDRETLLVKRSALSTTSNTTVRRMRFGPDGRAWVLGQRSGTGFIELVERLEDGEILTSAPAGLPAVERWEDISFDVPDASAVLLASGGASGSWQFRLYRWDEDDGFEFELLRSASAQCTRLARVDTAAGAEGWVVTCGPIGTPSIWYYSPGDGEARTGFGSTGNLSGIAAHPDHEYAIIISSSGRRVHRFEAETLLETGFDPFRFSTRAILDVRFSGDGRRAGIFGQMTAASGGLLLEYRHDFYRCPAPLVDCDIVEVSVPNFDGPPWLGQGSATSFTDMAWHPSCKGGLIVGGDSSFGTLDRGLAVLFDLGDEKQGCNWRDVREDFRAPPPDPGIDADAPPVAPSAYDWRRLSLGSIGFLQSADTSDDGEWIVIVGRNGGVHAVARDTLAHETLTLPGGGGATLYSVRYGPDGRFWILGERGGQGIVYWLRRAEGTWEWETPPALPGQQPYRAIRWDTGDGTALLLASAGTGVQITRVERWDPEEEEFLLVSAFNAGHTCLDFARVDNELGEKGWLIPCNTVLRYLTRVAGVYELRSGAMLGTTNLGNTGRVTSHPSWQYALFFSSTGRRIHPFEEGRILGSGVQISNAFDNSRMLRFSPTGRRALIAGGATGSPLNAFVKEYRHNALSPEDVIDVGMPAISQSPWNQGSGSRFADVAWFPDCDGGLLVGGDNSSGLAALFERAGGTSCGLPD